METTIVFLAFIMSLILLVMFFRTQDLETDIDLLENKIRWLEDDIKYLKTKEK